MIRKQDLQVGDYVHLGFGAERYPRPLAVVGVLGNVYLSEDCDDDSREGVMCVEENEIHPVLISEDILEWNGWKLTNGIWNIKSIPRLGWNPMTAQLIINFHVFYEPIKYVHQLQQMMRLLKIRGIEL